MFRRHASPASLLTALSSTLAAATLAAATLGGCVGSEHNDPLAVGAGGTSTSATSSVGSGEIGGAPGSGGSGGSPDTLKRKTISGEMTWQVTFDDVAHAAGATDCSYTRHYEGVEDLSAPWRCPGCEVMFHADVELTAGAADCFSQVSPDPAAAAEWLGYGNGVWYRGIEITSDQGTANQDGEGLATANAVMDLDALVGGKMAFDIAGAFVFGEAEGDPQNGFVPPETYACGWPKANAPPYEGDYLVQIGATLPDGVFLDACDEPVRLHDFKGSYLIVEMGARDCPPCQIMAQEEEAFLADMKAQGVNVRVITLLAPSLAEPLAPTTNAMLEGWISKFALTSPVLADRAWGVAMFLPLYPDTLSYPSWVLVDPDLKIMDLGTGFGGFADFSAAILADVK